MRIELVHPALLEASKDPKKKKQGAPDRGGITEKAVVHLFSANLKKALQFLYNGKKIQWRGWRDPQGLAISRVRIANHYTVKNRKLVAFISPLKPKGSRAVFRGSRASAPRAVIRIRSFDGELVERSLV